MNTQQPNDPDTEHARHVYGRVDTSKWPTVIIKLIGSPGSDQDLNDLFAAIDALYDNDKVFVMIIDLLDADYIVNPRYIYAMIQHMRKMTVYTKKYVPCLCLIVESSMMIRTIDYIKTIRSPEVPWYTFQTVNSAVEYIDHMLHQ